MTHHRDPQRPLASAGLRRRARRLVAATALVLAAHAAGPSPATATEGDPWMGLNRHVFAFNDALDRWILVPVAKGYDFVMPERAEQWVTNFTTNLWFPVTFVNCVLQAKPREATQSLARFIVNTTFGIGGFGDPATSVDIPAPYEDFGQTLGHWGVGPGPYMVLPFLGPSNVRDTAGRAADSATVVWPYFVPWYASTTVGVVDVVSTRERYLDQVDDLRRTSVDFYAATRDAYLQRRQALVEDRVGSVDEKKHLDAEDDLYFPEGSEE